MVMKTLLTASAVAVATASTALGATISLTGGTPTADVGDVPGQDFVSDLQGVGATTLYSGPLQLNAAGPVKLTFSLVAAESGFNNALLYDGTAIITENVSNDSVDFATGVLNGQTAMRIFAGGDLADLLSFDINNNATADFDAGDDEFGVFANAGNVGALSVFYLALDDSGAGNDDNHDDIIVRVNVAPVPLPAGGLLLLTALGGVVALRRKRKAA